MSFIEARTLVKRYGDNGETVEALRRVDLQVESGEFVAVMGPSGSGKSTLLTILGGLSHPTEGEVVVDEIDIYRLSTDRLADFRSEYIGFIFQSFQLLPYLTALENVSLPLIAADINGREQQALAEQALERVDLASKRHRLPDRLSGGEQERVAIARALVNSPPILLADEPTGNLDQQTSQDILRLFGELHEEGQTIIMITHNPENTVWAERMVHIRDGRVVNGHG